jgi:hypothetical protein
MLSDGALQVLVCGFPGHLLLALYELVLGVVGETQFVD